MSGNQSPEQQQAMKESLQATISEINAQISFFENAISTHRQAQDRYRNLSSQFPGLGRFMDAEISDEQQNINQLEDDIRTKQGYIAYYEQLLHALNPDMAP